MTKTVFKLPSPAKKNESKNGNEVIVEREKIQQFWDVYRKATKHRIAGKTEMAVSDYREALAINNIHEDALYYLGNMYIELGEFDSAESTWKRLIEINPYSSRTHSQLGKLYLTPELEELFDVEAAEQEFLTTLEINSDDTGPFISLGYVALIRGNLFDARRSFNTVIASNFKNVEAYFLNGYIDWKMGNLQKALTPLVKAWEYSLPSEPVQGVPGEGDTKTGRPLGFPDGLMQRNLFQDYIGDLSKLDKAELPQKMNDMYHKLDLFLVKIRGRIQSK